MAKGEFEYDVQGLGVQGMLGNPNYPRHLDNKDGVSLYRFHYRNSFRKTMSMFKYNNLPDTVDKRVIELTNQSAGYSVWYTYMDNLYCGYGRLGGIPNFNYIPTKAIVTNPYLKLSKDFTVGEDCVVMRNDTMYMGLSEVNSYYSYQLKDNDLSRRLLLVNLRAMVALLAEDDDDYQNCLDFLKALEDGKQSAIHSKSWSKKVESLPLFTQGSSQTLIQIIEDKQYIKGSWLNDLGVQSNYNMKRETITSNENILNVDGLLPLVDDMLECRQEDVEKINKMFGTKITVELNSSWKKIRKEIAISEERQEKEVANLNQSTYMEKEEDDGTNDIKENNNA